MAPDLLGSVESIQEHGNDNIIYFKNKFQLQYKKIINYLYILSRHILLPLTDVK